MLTKYEIEIDGIKHEIDTSCIKNWGDVLCAYKRASYSGVTRSFTSQFEFVNEAYDMLMMLYLRDGFNAKAVLTLYTITERWEWEERFSAPIDFSSLTWDDYVLKVNCIDNSLAALIKSRKSTKYEFVVGQDIKVADKLLFDRVTMINQCAHEIMGHGTDEYNEAYVAINTSYSQTTIPTYIVGDGKTYENSPILFTDQTEGEGSHFLETVEPVDELEISIRIESDYKRPVIYSEHPPLLASEFRLIQFGKDGTGYKNLGTIYHYDYIETDRKLGLGIFPSFDVLADMHSNATPGSWALIGINDKDLTEAYVMTCGDNPKWEKGSLTCTEARPNRIIKCRTIIWKKIIKLSNIPAGQCFAITYNSSFGGEYANLSVKSSIQTKWTSRAKAIEIDAISPESVLYSIVDRICDGKINIKPHIDSSDPRIPKTFILAGESIRNIPGAKFYSTFNDFCNWMAAVFGYTYYLGDIRKSKYKGAEPFTDGVFTVDDAIKNEECPAENIADIRFLNNNGGFAALNKEDWNFYIKWPAFSKDGTNYGSWKDYNDETTGKARKDKVFTYTSSGYSIFFNDEGESETYPEDPARCAHDIQDIHFVHRDSLFQGTNILKIKNVRDLHYSIATDFVVSTIVAGYDKQEYNSECGRDEWNFSAQYNTGVDLLEKKIELVSKYRADCYGIEFLAQKRANDTTDNKSDNNVFFVHCKFTDVSSGEGEEMTESTKMEIDRSVDIQGTLSDSVFNGEYSPMRCILANKGYLSAIKKNLGLKFASFDGNADVVIGGVPVSTELTFDNQMFTAGVIEFTTGDVDMPIDPTALYEVESDGIIYRGFLMEAYEQYSRNEARKYKLIVKEVKPCY